MKPGLRKLLLTTHIAASVGWFGAVASFLVLAITGVTSRDPQMQRIAYASMELTAQSVIVPLAITSLLSGIIQSLAGPWGLFRHYWVLAKLLLTTLATIVLLGQMRLISHAAHLASEATLSNVTLHASGTELTAHSVGALIVLLSITALSVYKPFGLTPYGQRKRQVLRTKLKDHSTH